MNAVLRVVAADGIRLREPTTSAASRIAPSPQSPRDGASVTRLRRSEPSAVPFSPMPAASQLFSVPSPERAAVRRQAG